MTPQPGDLFVCHGSAIGDRLISFGQRIHDDGKYARWTHAGIIVGAEVDGDHVTVEAQAHGVGYHWLSDHSDRLVLPCPAGVDRAKAVEFAKSQVGAHYNWAELVEMGIDCVAHTHLHDTDKGQWICSELAAASWVAGGWQPSLSAADTMAADLAREATT